MEMQVLTQSLPLFKKLKAQLITVSPQLVEKSKELKEKFPGAFDILADVDYAIAKNYKVYHEMPEELTGLYKSKFKLDLEEYNGKGRTALPVAGTFVISKEGKVVAAFCDTDYKKRMEPHAILLALSKLPKPAK
jgi:peroxiredoxin